MNLPPPPKPVRVPVTILSRLAIWFLGCYGIAQGIWICFGGIERWSAPAYSIIARLPGSPYSWGVPIAMFGAVVLVGSWRRNFGVKFTGLALTAGWCLAFSSLAFAATFSNPLAGTTGGPTYLLVALLALPLCFYDESRRT